MKNEYMFNFDDEEIFPSAEKNADGMEDIVSDSRYAGKGRPYVRKKRGISRLFGKTGYAISSWWHRCAVWQRAFMITLISLALVFAVAVGIIGTVFDYNYNKITKDPEDLGFEKVIDKKIVNVALFGIDSRQEGVFKGLSDSIMIMSLNTSTKKVKIISVMRDTLTPITHNGKTVYTKINAAYSKGGPELAIKTLNTIFDLDISEYATVNFYGMADIIDAVGGIDATLTQGELNIYGYENGHNANFGINGMIQEQCKYLGIDPTPYYINKAGIQHLNGIQAVAYARIRKAANIDGTNNDQGRTDRQRYVMEQLFNKALTLNKSQYVKLAKVLIPCSETSLSYTEIIDLAFSILLSSPKFEQTRVPLSEYQMPSPSTGSYVYFDLDYAADIIHAFIYDEITPEDYIEANGVRKNDWYAKIKSSSGNTASSDSSTDITSNTESNTGDDVQGENNHDSGDNSNVDSGDSLIDSKSSGSSEITNSDDDSPSEVDSSDSDSKGSDSSDSSSEEKESSSSSGIPALSSESTSTDR